uniref:[histone H3]-lysine(4) N-trimethyltransferase n=1 Tax=Sander lucioperca TaxID=283035 RepID=A0A8D0DDL8_SANLU
MGSIEGLERFDSPGKGRGLRVTRPFKVGELLFSSPAYSFVLSLSERGCYCEFCFTRKEGLARCGKCKKAFYCGVKCQKGDWAMHKLECSAMTAFGENWCPSETSRLVARILAKKVGKNLIKDTTSFWSVFWHILWFIEDVDNEKREMTESDIAGLHRFFSKHLELPDHKDLLTLFSQVACNGFTIEDDELSHMGTAVYPDVALINHSCLPSVIVTYKGTSAEVRAVKNMNPGDEVLISYIDLLYPTDDRNNRLREFYYFTCQCQECKTKSSDKAKLKVRKQSDPIEQELKLDAALDSVAPPSELLEMCEQSLDEMGAVFDDTNVYMLHMMYQAMGVCLYMQDPDGAIRYGEKIIKPYSKLYPPYSLNVSSMYLKLGRLYMGLERYSVGVGALKKAMAIMEVAHGRDHFYLTELRKEMTRK